MKKRYQLYSPLVLLAALVVAGCGADSASDQITEAAQEASGTATQSPGGNVSEKNRVNNFTDWGYLSWRPGGYGIFVLESNYDRQHWNA